MMKLFEELGIGCTPWKVECVKENKKTNVKVCRVKNCYDQTMVEEILESVANMMAESPNVYDKAVRLARELDMVIDTNQNGNWVIDCECSHVVFALEELKEALVKSSGGNA